MFSSLSSSSSGLQIPYFEQQKEYKQGNWEYDLSTHLLHWSKTQYTIYGYEPEEFPLNDEYFILKTTHHSEVKRIVSIIDNAIKKQEDYSFQRRILKKNGQVGFVETQAVIIKSQAGVCKKIIGTTIDLENSATEKIFYNDPRFFNILYSRYHNAVLNEIHKIVTDTEKCNDLCQEVFMKAWHNMSQYDPKRGQLYTWLLNIAKNHCKDYFRSKEFRSDGLKVPLLDRTVGVTVEDPIDESQVFVRELLLELPIQQRELLELIYYQGFTHAEISKFKNMPLGTIKSRVRSALLQLKHLAQTKINLEVA